MTIELITGTPGAGKTTYAVSQRVAVECVRKLKMEDSTEYTRRVMAAGVRGLLLDHEKLPHKLTGEVVKDQEVDYWNQMLSGDAPMFQRLAGQDQVTEVLCPVENIMKPVRPLVQNWWLWCRPGDLIVIDESQFLAPRGALGRKPPYWIQALEIHRHYGVDFLFITQHPQLIDTTIRNLVGLHRHVRSVMGSPMCMLYTWDHASNPERAQLANKSSWIRRAKHYSLFHSSVAHVKPPNSGRVGLALVPVLLVAGYLGYTQFKKRFEPAQSVPIAAVDPAASVPAGEALPPSVASEPVFRIVGCIDGPHGGYCIDNQGVRVNMPPDVVAFNARNLGGFIKLEMGQGGQSPPLSPASRSAADPPASAPILASAESVKPSFGPSPSPSPREALDGAVLSDMKAF
jgi:hypothetical protein